MIGKHKGAGIHVFLVTYPPYRHRRPSMRLRGYDYASSGAYFVTICTYQRDCLFGKIANKQIQLSPFGHIAEGYWQEIPTHFSNVELDEFIVMPNHLHGIISIKHAVRNKQPGSVPADTFGNMMQPGALSTTMSSFKSATTRKINSLRADSGLPIWQRNYYAHIIRDERSYGRIQHYIRNNQLSWQQDQLHPDNPSKW